MRVSIIDYGIGNILSVRRALEFCGAQVELASSASDILTAEGLVLPGVGAFADGMKGLRERGLIDPIRSYASQGGLLLGICLGMQMLLDESEEFGNYEGLGLIPGRVKAIETTTAHGQPHKIPHVGWNSLEPAAGKTVGDWRDTILEPVEEGSEVYFVHSYTAFPVAPEDRLADTHYGGRLVSAVIKRGSVYGCQFHPEKSGPVGLEILRSFIDLARRGGA